MQYCRTKWLLNTSILALLLALSGAANAEHDEFIGPGNGDDTILVEKQVNEKIPYHKILKKISKRMFKFDAENILAFGKGRTDSVVRSFKDISERMKYRVDVDRDEVEFKLSLNF